MRVYTSVYAMHQLAPHSEMCLDMHMEADPPSRYLSADDAAKVRRMVDLPLQEVERLTREIAGIWKNVSPLDRPHYEACGAPEFMGDLRSSLRAYVLDGVAVIAVSSLSECAENVLLDLAQRFFTCIELACGGRLAVKAIALAQNDRLQESIRMDLPKHGITVVNSRDDQELCDLSADQVANLFVRRTCAHAYATIANIERLSQERKDESSSGVN